MLAFNDPSNNKSFRILYDLYNALQLGYSMTPKDAAGIKITLLLAVKEIIDMRKKAASDEAILFTELDRNDPQKVVNLGGIFEAMAVVAQVINEDEMAFSFIKENFSFELQHGKPLGIVTAYRNLTVGYMKQSDFTRAEIALCEVEQYLKDNKTHFPSGMEHIVKLRKHFEEQKSKH